jgi:hypothetical protein
MHNVNLNGKLDVFVTRAISHVMPDYTSHHIQIISHHSERDLTHVMKVQLIQG